MTGPGASYLSHFRGFNYDASNISNMPGYDIVDGFGGLLYGGQVATGDVDAGGTAELVTGPGPGFGTSNLRFRA